MPARSSRHFSSPRTTVLNLTLVFLIFRALISGIGDSALALLYPQACAVCGVADVGRRSDSPACEDCWNATRILRCSDIVCAKCGQPVTGCPVPSGESSEADCGRCQDRYFTAARACGHYDGALRASVLALKSTPHVGRRLIHLMDEARLQGPLCDASLIIPVPLHPTRERKRGFNQAALLARKLASRSGLKLAESALVRVTHTEKHRAGMDPRSRNETVEDAFHVRLRRLIDGEAILLVDDVLTTGATVSACSRVLLEAGAQSVSVLTIARVE